jgi:NAD(P)H-flavin reductase
MATDKTDMKLMTAAPAHPSPWLPAWWEIRRRTKESADTVSLHMTPPPGYSARPGQFNMLLVPGIGEVPISISSLRPDGSELVHTVRAVGAVSSALCRLKKGDRVGVRGPYGTSWPSHHQDRSDVIFAAGGIGLAPLRPAIDACLADKAFSGRVHVLYGAREPKDMILQSWLKQIASRSHANVQVTVDKPVAGWKGRVGFVTQLLHGLTFDPGRTCAMICGPDIMMNVCARELATRGVPETAVFVSLERSMKCAVGQCGRCQIGPLLTCRDGAVFDRATIARWNAVREL